MASIALASSIAEMCKQYLKDYNICVPAPEDKWVSDLCNFVYNTCLCDYDNGKLSSIDHLRQYTLSMLGKFLSQRYGVAPTVLAGLERGLGILLDVYLGYDYNTHRIVAGRSRHEWLSFMSVPTATAYNLYKDCFIKGLQDIKAGMPSSQILSSCCYFMALVYDFHNHIPTGSVRYYDVYMDKIMSQSMFYISYHFPGYPRYQLLSSFRRILPSVVDWSVFYK
jgi:hypothetical protein